MKDELGRKLIKEFDGLRAKVYSVLSLKHDKPEMKKAKGICKYVIKKKITHSNYVNCLFNKKIYSHRMNTLQCKYHKVYTIEQNKQSLSPYDNKRFLLSDGIHSLAHGHYRIQNNLKI